MKKWKLKGTEKLYDPKYMSVFNDRGVSKFFFALTFIVPITFLELSTAILASIFWGLFLITFFSFYMARSQKQNPYKVIAEHVVITALVVLLAHYLGACMHALNLRNFCLILRAQTRAHW